MHSRFFPARKGLRASLRRAVALAGCLLLLYAPVASAASGDSSETIYELETNTGYYNPNSAGCSPTDTVTPGAGSPYGTTFPNLDPTTMADAINTWIVHQNPNSEMKGLGTTIVASAKHSNINPFLLATIPKEESSMADPSVYNVLHGNNAYGREATLSQPHFIGSRVWYYWTSVKASVDYTAPENQHTNVGDMASYLRNSGFYTAALNSNDFVKFFMTYAPPSENNTTAYIANIKAWIAQLVALAKGGGGSTTGTTSGGGCTTTGAGGCVNPFGKISHGLVPERIDMGVDYAAPAGSPILAMCDAEIIGAAAHGTGWNSPTDTEACVYLRFTGGPYSGKYYFVCEDITPNVKLGLNTHQQVKAGQQIATFLPSPTGIETGWGSGTPWGALAAQLHQECGGSDPGCWATAAGVSFNKFLKQTGAKGGVFVPGAPPQKMPPGYP